MRRRAVITGVGVVTGLGVGVEPLWEGLLTGRSALAPVRQFDASSFPFQFASEVPDDFRIRDFVPRTYRKALKVMCRDIELAVGAAARAVADAAIITKAGSDNGADPTYPAARMGCQIGAGLIVAEINELTTAFAKARGADGALCLKLWGEQGMKQLTPLWLLKYLPNMLSCHVTIIHDCRGPSNTITCAEASGALSVGESMRVIERGDAELCFSGGAESKVNPLGLLRQWHTSMMAKTRADEDPTAVIRPFGVDARGTLPGEGAAILILEAEDAAEARGARVYATLEGFGASQTTDFQSGGLTPTSTGDALARAIRSGLRRAELSPDDIDAIVPMAIGSPGFDEAESAALSTVFGDRLSQVPIVTTKAIVGLCGASASALDIAVAALCLAHQTLPARINGDNVRPGIDAATVGTRDARLNHVLVCGCGLGGQNTALVLGRPRAGSVGEN